MASASRQSLLLFLLVSCLLLLSTTARTALAARHLLAANSAKQKAPAAQAAPTDAATQPDCDDDEHEGSVLVPGLGRVVVGQLPALPTIGDTYGGGSIPAARNAHYLPGGDDTFIPNPGFYVPNPFRGGSGGQQTP